ERPIRIKAVEPRVERAVSLESDLVPAEERVVRVGDVIDVDGVVTSGAGEIPRLVGGFSVGLPRIAAAGAGVLHVLELGAVLVVKRVRAAVAVEEIEAGSAIELIAAGRVGAAEHSVQSG